MIRSVLIIGAGIAGTLLAWRLQQRGVAVTLIDDARPGRSSAAAAGLLNPITGRRLAVADRAPQLLPEAIQFYQEIEAHFHDLPVFHPMPIMREWQSQEERMLGEQRLNEPEFSRLASPVEAGRFDHGGLLIRGGGWIAYDELLELPARSGIPVQSGTVTAEDLDCRPEGVYWRDACWEAVVFCQGYAPETVQARGLDWNPAAGDILTVRLPGWDPDRIRVRDWFTIPLGDDRFRVGSTYHRDDLSVHPKVERANQLLRGLSQWTGRDPELLEHRVGIRPILRRRRPLIGPLPELPRAFICNGLGSKGGLWAPWAAGHLAALLLEPGSQPDPVLRPPAHERPRRLTAVAHEAVRPFLHRGTWAIDATAGNGHDTVFLAEAVEESGCVFACDLQEAAIANTGRRLEAHGLVAQVQLIPHSHAELIEWLPEAARGRIRVVMMNLGYLPAADRSVITQAASTLVFLGSVLPLMAEEAVISVLAYRGHPGGHAEHAAVMDWMQNQEAAGWQLTRTCGDRPESPELFLLRRFPGDASPPAPFD